MRKLQIKKSRLPWGNRYVWLLMIMFGFQSGVYYSLATWLAPKVQDMGYSDAYAATTVTIFFLSCRWFAALSFPS
ncbi:hypothetical protein OL548_22035 [Lysinibacillus sp. MHQ-1]|nr:hypothetical protein OL548_22035 [Lysinibacillus sp. MHQ-1]